VHFGNVDTKPHDGKKPKLKASDVPARKQWNKSIPKTAADFIRLLFVCIHTGDPRYKYDASVDNVQKDEATPARDDGTAMQETLPPEEDRHGR
jgi:hypothetical protein